MPRCPQQPHAHVHPLMYQRHSRRSISDRTCVSLSSLYQTGTHKDFSFFPLLEDPLDGNKGVSGI